MDNQKKTYMREYMRIYRAAQVHQELKRILNARTMRRCDQIREIVKATTRKYQQCIIFPGAKLPTGYGFAKDYSSGLMRTASRIALETKLDRPLREGMETLHSCHNRGCVNPNHLSEGDHLTNIRQSVALGRWNQPRQSLRILTPEKVRGIRILRQRGISYRKLAKMYDVGEATIRGIITGKNYKDVD